MVRKPYVDYTEVFLDDGQVDMFAVMKELVRQKYARTIYPEHRRAIDPDRDSGAIRSQYPGGGGFAGEIYNVKGDDAPVKTLNELTSPIILSQH